MADFPAWTPLSEVPAPPVDDRGRVVAIVATEEAADSGWAPGAALDLARSWSADGQRVIVVDGGLTAPSLHEAAGVANREGLVDAILHGASIAHVSHALDDGALFLVTSGSPVASPATVVRSPRWNRVADGITEAGVILLLYLRDGQDGTAAFLGSASEIVVLSGRTEGPPGAVGDLAPLVRAVTGRDHPRAESESESESAAAGPPSKTRGASPTAPKVFEDEEKGVGRLVLLLLGALAVAAALGFLLTSLP